jgi:hypothetical protein
MINRGIITTYVLVFGAIFLILLVGLLGFILLQLRQSNQKVAWNESLYVAEAGINYYQWCLNNEVGDNCQAQKDYTDPAGDTIGTFSLEVTEGVSCGETIQRTIVSSGWTEKFPATKRKIKVSYGRESVAKYAYLLNDNVWAGGDREIRGFYHSNGGVRMDGENQSLVTSAKDEWVCTSSFGCSPCPASAGCHTSGGSCFCPGVFTTTQNSNPDLFDFPVPSFDFDGITIDLAKIKALTLPYPQQYYWPPVTDINPQGKGYHLILNNNGTFEIRIITGLQRTWACHIPCDSSDDYYYDYFTITNEYSFGTPVSINPACSLVFVEDNLWIEGEVKGKLTVAAANLQSPGVDVDVVLPANIDYTVLDGSDGLAVIGERDVLVGPQSPSQMELRGIFIAQKGYFGRNYYQNNIREKLEIYGSVVSNGRVGTQWTSGGQIVSGYRKRESYFDTNLVYNPPYFVPYIRPDFKIINWEEVE